MPRQQIRSKQHARRRQDERRRQFRFYAGLIVFFAILLVSITHWRAIQIQNVEVEASDYIDSELVVDLTENILSEPAFGVISRRNIILTPRHDIRQKVQDVSTRIERVEVNIIGLQSIRIKILDRQPIAEVCRQQIGRTLQSCYFIDADSFVFSRGDSKATTTSGLTFVVDSELKQRTQLLPPTDFQNLYSFIQALDEVGLSANLAYLKEYGDVTISATDATNRDRGSVDLRVNIYSDLSQVMANLQTVLDNDSFVARTPINGEIPETISPFSLDYIDLRFDNKVFYR